MVRETTALNAAYLDGLQMGLFPPPEQFSSSWKKDKHFTPALDEEVRIGKYNAWKDSVRRNLTK